jgi:hypothetical protein
VVDVIELVEIVETAYINTRGEKGPESAIFSQVIS